MGNRKGQRFAVDLMPEDIKKIFIDLLENKRLTMREIADKMAGIGYPLSKSAVGRYAIKIRKGLKRLKGVGVPYTISNKYRADFKELAWLLLEREILTDRIQEKEQEIKLLKQKIPFFKEFES